MGADQGRCLRTEIQSGLPRPARRCGDGLRTLLSPYTSGPVRGAGAGRELIRHFTHLSERVDGLARAAGRPVDALLDAHLRTDCYSARFGPSEEDTAAVIAAGAEGAARLELVLPWFTSERVRWVVRRSRPEVGFRSLELTLPWMVSAVAGVNEAGLCVGITPGPRPIEGPPAAPPALLLVQECLQRFQQTQGALDWCVQRPVCGEATVLLGDAAGSIASVRIRGSERLPSWHREPMWLVAGREEDPQPLAAGSAGPAPDANRADPASAGLSAFHAKRCDSCVHLRAEASSRTLALQTPAADRTEFSLA